MSSSTPTDRAPLIAAEPEQSTSLHVESNARVAGLTFESPGFMMSSPVVHLRFDSDIDEDSAKIADIPTALNTLLTAPVINNSDKLSSISTRKSLKRQSPEVEDNGSIPVLKRWRPSSAFERSHSLDLTPVSRVQLKRCHSETEATIISALDRVSEDGNIISDGSKTFCLPTIPGKHQDLKSITPETLTKVLNQEYDDVIEQFVVVDCRYTYEYEGGHIQGAKNYYTKDDIVENLIQRPIRAKDNQKRIVLIFHCEFSSERGPKMLRFLRAMDRDCNKECYPDLFYPEMYLLHGGYKNFFEHQQELCSPQTYMPMHHEDYKEDLRKCRIKSKSWAGETSRSSLRRGLKF